MSQCVQAEKPGVFFWGLGVKASLDKTGFHKDVISPSRAAVSSSRMRPLLSAVLTSAVPHPNPSPSVPLSPSHLHPWDFLPVSICPHFAHSHPLLSAASFLPCSCLPIPVLGFSVVLVLLCLIHESFCLSSAGPPASGPCLSGIALGSPAPALTVRTFPALRWCSLPCKKVSGALSINKDFRVCRLRLAAANRPK